MLTYFSGGVLSGVLVSLMSLFIIITSAGKEKKTCTHHTYTHTKRNFKDWLCVCLCLTWVVLDVH